MDTQQLSTLILLAPGAILAIALHEAMHGYVANRLGDPTARIQGRLTLNPFKHIDPFGTILVPALLYYTGGVLFGWAKPVPVNVLNLNNPKRDMALVAAAGPAANLLLALIAAAVLFLLTLLLLHLQFNEQTVNIALRPLLIMMIFMLKFNVMLMFFNLIPIPPLDGGRILVGLLPLRQAQAVAAVEPFGMFILIGLLVINQYVPIFSYSLYPAANLVLSILLPSELELAFGV